MWHHRAVTTNKIVVGDITLTRVGYADVPIDPARVGLDAAQIAALAWAEPVWATGGQPLAGAAAWIVESGAARIVIDPAQAADEILRTPSDAAAHQRAFAAAMAAAGFERSTITHVVATHVETIGMFAWRDDDGSWSPFFPAAAMFAPGRDLAALDAGTLTPANADAFAQLRDHGVVHAVGDAATAIADGVVIEHSGGHCAGHSIVRIESRGQRAIFVGHLAVTPLHLGTGECPQQNVDAPGTEQLLDGFRSSGAWLAGPLWPAPGAGRWIDGALVPANP